MFDSITAVLPIQLRKIIQKLPAAIADQIEEIRIREQRPLEIIYQKGYAFVSPDGQLLEVSSSAYIPTREDCLKLLDLLANHSVYTLEEELKRGFITITGGHRVGLAGKVVTEQGKVKFIRHISAFNIRIARPIWGCGMSVLPLLRDEAERTLHHTLILSPPQMGKTTLLRDLARLISYGNWGPDRPHWNGRKIGIVDERSEIAACHQGVPQFDIGPRTDVLDRCPKAEGMMMMIRSLSPDVLAVDEIGVQADTEAIQEAANAGIRLLATAHAESFIQLQSRPMFRNLIEQGTFSRYVLLHRTGTGARTYEVLDYRGNVVKKKPVAVRKQVQ